MTENKSPEIQSIEINTELIKTINWQELEKADWESLVMMGQDIGEIKTYTQWALGMLGHTIIRRHGDLKKYASDIRQKYGSLRQYMYTYKKFVLEDSNFHPNKYYGSVPWGVLALAATKSDKPQKLVDELQKEGKEITLETAYREIKKMESPESKDPPRKPVVKLKWDKNTNLYKIEMNPKDFPSIDWSDVKEDLKEWLHGLA